MISDTLFAGLKKYTAERDPLSNFWYKTFTSALPVHSRVHVTSETSENLAAVWRATSIYAGTVGWLPFNLYRRLPDGGRTIERSHHIHELLHDQPNPEMTAMVFRSMMVRNQVNRGNGYAEISRDSMGRPAALWPIDPSRVDPKRDERTEEVVYEVTNNDGTTVLIPSEDMFHVPSIITDDGIIGKGIIEKARETIGHGIATEQYGSSLFGRGGLPQIVIEHPGQLSQEARKNFRKEWSEIYGGTDGSKVGLLQEGASARTLNLSNEDLQFIATRQFNVEEIARWYGLPPHLLQQLQNSTMQNVELTGRFFVIFSLVPWLRLWEETVRAKLLGPIERGRYFAEFSLQALMRGDSRSRAEFYRTLINIGVMSRNEVRQRENLNPVDGGDRFIVQGAMAPIDDEGNVGTPIGRRMEAEGEDRREKMMTESAKCMLQETLQRMVTKEAKAMRNASRNSSGFIGRVDEFYDKQEKTLQDAIRQPVEALLKLGFDLNSSRIAGDICKESKEELLNVAGEVSPSELESAVVKLTEQWEETKSERLVSSLIGRAHDK